MELAGPASATAVSRPGQSQSRACGSGDANAARFWTQEGSRHLHRRYTTPGRFFVSPVIWNLDSPQAARGQHWADAPMNDGLFVRWGADDETFAWLCRATFNVRHGSCRAYLGGGHGSDLSSRLTGRRGLLTRPSLLFCAPAQS